MQDLTLIGVHEDGQHVLLADGEGNRFRVELDDALVAAARRDRPRLGQIQIEIEGGLRPKDVQAMIRAGMSPEEVAERAGWTVEKVHRYEGPILAERAHVAGLARLVRLRARGVGQSASPTLGDRVEERLRSRELDPAAVAWDSHRADRSSWVVVLRFVAGGREREAAWDFDPLARTVVARDDEARWLSEDEDTQSTGPIPAPHLNLPATSSRPAARPAARTAESRARTASTPPSRPSAVYDVDAEGGLGSVAERKAADTLDLMEAMRERSQQRGRRRRPRATDVPALEHAPEEALPLEELAQEPVGDPPAAHPRQGRGARGTRGAAPRRATGGPDHDPDETTPIPTSVGQPARAGAARGRDDLGEREDDREVLLEVDDASSGREPSAEDLEDPRADEASEARPRPRPTAAGRPTARKSGRPSVPSWDDIMFGRKSE